MKKFWQFLMVLLVGVGVWMGPCALAGWARPNPAFDGHGHGHGWNKEKGDHGRGHGRHEHWDNGRHRGWYRAHDGRYRFDDHDRGVFVSFYREHRHERWFRQPMPRGVTLAYGYVLAPRYRGYCHPLPVAMLDELPPPPPRCHYFLFGGNVILADDGYRVHDFVQLNFSFGR